MALSVAARPRTADPFERYRPSWAPLAACAGRDVEIFHPEADGSSVIPWGVPSGPIGEAKRICASCSFTAECLAYAYQMEAPGEHRSGIYGGATGPEREQASREPDRLAVVASRFAEQVKQWRL